MIPSNQIKDSPTEIARGLQNDDAGEAIQSLLREDAALCNSMKNLLANISENSQESLEKHEIRIWKPFDGFTRRINHRTVMSAPSGIVQDLLPGQYKLSDLIDYPDIPALEPQKTVVEGVQWIEGQEGVKNGQKCWIRPSLCLAYGASILESSDETVTLDSRHALQVCEHSNLYSQLIQTLLSGFYL